MAIGPPPPTGGLRGTGQKCFGGQREEGAPWALSHPLLPQMSWWEGQRAMAAGDIATWLVLQAPLVEQGAAPWTCRRFRTQPPTTIPWAPVITAQLPAASARPSGAPATWHPPANYD